jgi:hypothetical protein
MSVCLYFEVKRFPERENEYVASPKGFIAAAGNLDVYVRLSKILSANPWVV